MKLLLTLAALGVAGFVFDRLMLKAEERGWIYWRKKKGSHGMAASATLEVQQLIEPSKKYVLEVQQDQAPESDEEGDPPSPGELTHPGKAWRPAAMTTFANPDEAAIRSLLEEVKRVVVVGLSPKPHRDSNRIARYLREQGYEVVPVYPREDEILGQKVYRCVRDVPGPIDLVNVFRRSEDLPAVFDDILASGATAVWTQLGCVDEDGARRAREAGLTVVMNRCVMVDHARLLGRD